MNKIVIGNNEYKELLSKIKEDIIIARNRAYQAVNKQSVELYINTGKRIYGKIEISKWGMGIVEKLSSDLQREFPDMKGFSRENLWRMKKLYETYKDYTKLSPLVTELSWSVNLVILFQTDSIGKMQFYLSALDEKIKLKEENPSVGLILCKSKNEEVQNEEVIKDECCISR